MNYIIATRSNLPCLSAPLVDKIKWKIPETMGSMFDSLLLHFYGIFGVIYQASYQRVDDLVPVVWWSNSVDYDQLVR